MCSLVTGRTVEIGRQLRILPFCSMGCILTHTYHFSLTEVGQSPCTAVRTFWTHQSFTVADLISENESQRGRKLKGFQVNFLVRRKAFESIMYIPKAICVMPRKQAGFWLSHVWKHLRGTNSMSIISHRGHSHGREKEPSFQTEQQSGFQTLLSFKVRSSSEPDDCTLNETGVVHETALWLC